MLDQMRKLLHLYEKFYFLNRHHHRGGDELQARLEHREHHGMAMIWLPIWSQIDDHLIHIQQASIDLNTIYKFAHFRMCFQNIGKKGMEIPGDGLKFCMRIF